MQTVSALLRAYCGWFCLVVAVGLTIAGCAETPTPGSEPSPQLGTLVGQMEPVPEVATEISLLSETGMAVTAPVTSDGSYEFRNLPVGNYLLEVTVPGYETAQQEITVIADTVVQVEPITLHKLMDPVAQLRGVIVDQSTKKGIGGVQVQLKATDGSTHLTLTDDAGVFELPNLPVDQPFSLQIELDGYEMVDQPVEPLEADSVGKIEIQLIPIQDQLPLGQGLEIGTPAPNFTLPDGNGNLHTLYDYLGQKIVLLFDRGSW